METTLSGFRFGSGDADVGPVETIWYSSAAVANRYALASAPVNVQSCDACQESSAFGENLVPDTSGWTQRPPADYRLVEPFFFEPFTGFGSGS